MSTIVRPAAILLILGVATGHPPQVAGGHTPDGTIDHAGAGRRPRSDCNQNGIPDDIETAVTFRFHAITDAAAGANTAVSGDLDGDGDPDVVSTSKADDKIAWYANLDGSGTFGDQNLVDTVSDPYDVKIADLDHDGDADLLVATSHHVCWYENLDGAGSFGPIRMIDDFWVIWYSVDAADFDDDGDLDVVAGSVGSDAEFLSWYRNVDGAGTFELVQDLEFSAVYSSVAGVDVDGDGDNDVVSATIVGLRWWENLDGQGDFGEGPGGAHTVWFGSCSGFHAQAPEDVDGDGDVDLLIATSSGFFDPYDCDETHWFENTDGAATFSDPRMISDDILRSRHVFTADVNGDGSPDALSASYEDDKIAWYENLDGLGQFGPQMVVTEFAGGASWVTAGDLDADGDVDLVTASAQAGKIDWYENRSDDCNGNAIPDVCEPDCNSNGIADSCDIRSGFDLDCDLNGVPDLCQTTCGGCDTDSDGCIDDVDSDPTDPYRCGDTDLDQCDDCSSGVFDPWDDGTNSDSDGICDVGDCAPTDNEVWSEPSAIDSLVASRLGPTVGFSWQHPARRGALRVRYDTLRSTLASDFEVPAECIESDSLVAHTSDPEIPAPIAPFFYLVRGETCPSGTGNMGAGSDGVPRTGRSCP